MALLSKPKLASIIRPIIGRLVCSSSSPSCSDLNLYEKPLIMGIETSCDDTGVAILNGKGHILADIVKSQQAFSTKFGGVVPLFAASQHQANLCPAVEEALEEAKLKIQDITAVAITTRPGLIICLQEGIEVALQICKKYDKPLIPIHHMKAHALTARMTDDVKFPYMCLLISGGHALITWVESIDKFYILGKNTDIAPGDVFDKVARRLKLAHMDSKYRSLSGGALVEMLARRGDPLAINFKAPTIKRRADCNFSFSGILVQALRKIDLAETEHSITPGNVIPNVNDMCASVQHAVFRHLARKLMRAFEYIKLKHSPSKKLEECEVEDERNTEIEEQEDQYNFYPKTLVVSGGVASNEYIRRGLEYLCSQYRCKPVCPPKKYCTDNGVMIAWNGLEKWRANQDIFYRAPMSYFVEGKCPIGEDVTEDVLAKKLTRYVMNHTKSSFKLSYDFNKPLSDTVLRKDVASATENDENSVDEKAAL